MIIEIINFVNIADIYTAAAIGQQPDRFEAELHGFFERVRDCYLERARLEPQRFLVVDATGTPEQVEAMIRRGLEPLVARST